MDDDGFSRLVEEFQRNCEETYMNIQILNSISLLQSLNHFQMMSTETFSKPTLFLPPPTPLPLQSSDSIDSAVTSSSDLISSVSIGDTKNDSSSCVFDGLNVLRAKTHGRSFFDLFEFEDSIKKLLIPLIRSELQSGPKKIIIVLKFFSIKNLDKYQFIEFVQIITLYGVKDLFHRIEEFSIYLIDTTNGDREADDRAAVILANKFGGKVITNDTYRNWDAKFMDMSISAEIYKFILNPSKPHMNTRICSSNICMIEELVNEIPCECINYSKSIIDPTTNLRPQSRQGFKIESDGTASSGDLNKPYFVVKKNRKNKKKTGPKKKVGKHSQQRFKAVQKRQS